MPFRAINNLDRVAETNLSNKGLDNYIVRLREELAAAKWEQKRRDAFKGDDNPGVVYDDVYEDEDDLDDDDD